MSRRLSAAAIVVAVAVVITAWQVPSLVRTLHQRLSLPSISPTERELVPAGDHGVSTMALVLAAQTLPRNATYTIVVGQVPPLEGTTAQEIDVLFDGWLLPRRYTPTLVDAQWAITYHESSERLGVPYTREIGLGPDANAVKLGR